MLRNTAVIAVLAVCFALADGPGARAGEPGAAVCRDVKQIELRRERILAESERPENVRRDVIREALVEALERAAGMEVAAGIRSETRSTLRSVEQETRAAAATRTRGTILSWSVVEEDVGAAPDGSSLLTLTVSAEICVDPGADRPLHVAVAEPRVDPPLDPGFVRAEIEQIVSQDPRFVLVDADAAIAFYDWLIAPVIEIETRVRDNSARIALLERLAGQRTTIARKSLRELVVRCRLTATPFAGSEKLSIIIERRGFPLPDKPETDKTLTEHLVKEAIIRNAPTLLGRLSLVSPD